jgi:hypothetical protein
MQRAIVAVLVLIGVFGVWYFMNAKRFARARGEEGMSPEAVTRSRCTQQCNRGTARECNTCDMAEQRCQERCAKLRSDCVARCL